jgi:hypothetical protein
VWFRMHCATKFILNSFWVNNLNRKEIVRIVCESLSFQSESRRIPESLLMTQ